VFSRPQVTVAFLTISSSILSSFHISTDNIVSLCLGMTINRPNRPETIVFFVMIVSTRLLWVCNGPSILVEEFNARPTSIRSTVSRMKRVFNRYYYHVECCVTHYKTFCCRIDTWSGNSCRVEKCRIVHLEVAFDDCSFSLAGSVFGTEQILGIDLEFHMLKPGDADNCQEHGHQKKVPGMSGHHMAESVKGFRQPFIDAFYAASHVCRTKSKR